MDAPPKELLLAQTENYVEYSKFGRVIHGQEKAVARSKYEEDVYPGNHTVSHFPPRYHCELTLLVDLGLVLQERQVGLHLLPFA